MTPQITIVSMLAVTLAAALYVAWPLLFGRVRPEEYMEFESTEPALQRLYFQRDNTYAAMKELQFDFASGNLSSEDFQQLQERYKRKAVAILKRIDDTQAGRRTSAVDDDDFTPVSAGPGRRSAADSAVELDVEQEIEAFRRKHSTSRASESLKCPSCGRPVKDPDSAFCNKCGAPICGSSGQGSKRAGKSREGR